LDAAVRTAFFGRLITGMQPETAAPNAVVCGKASVHEAVASLRRKEGFRVDHEHRDKATPLL
jgi:hypothetical protein